MWWYLDSARKWHRFWELRWGLSTVTGRESSNQFHDEDIYRILIYSIFHTLGIRSAEQTRRSISASANLRNQMPKYCEGGKPSPFKSAGDIFSPQKSQDFHDQRNVNPIKTGLTTCGYRWQTFDLYHWCWCLYLNLIPRQKIKELGLYIWINLKEWTIPN